MNRFTLHTATLFGALATGTGAFAQAQPYAGQHGPMGGWGWGWSGGMLLGPFLLLLFLALAAAVIVLVVRWINGDRTGPSSASSSAKSALDILRERYARGEIDTEEFEARKRALAD